MKSVSRDIENLDLDLDINDCGDNMPRPKEHDVKCWPEPFEALADSRKTHEFRKNDRDFKVGDFLLLREWDPNYEQPVTISHYTGRKLVCLITYLSRGPQFGIPEGYVVLSVYLVPAVTQTPPPVSTTP